MRLDASCTPAFARHETFHPRYGWVKKAVDAVAADTNVFNQDNAVVELGVGKNMVRSIRHWGVSFKVIAMTKGDAPRASACGVTAFGEVLFGERGWDAYAEQLGTLWLLHWMLLAPRCNVPVWWLAFNEFSGIEFTDEQLEQFVIDRTRGWAEPHPSSIKKDVSCMLRMYAQGHSRASFDDAIDCPFRDLELMRPSSVTAGAYRFLVGEKPTLPPSIAAFACLDFLARVKAGANTVTVSRLATEPGAPGRVFRLSEAALLALLEEAASLHDDVEITQVAGVPQVVFAGEPAYVATELLRDYYRWTLGDGAVRFAGPLLLAGDEGLRVVSRAAGRLPVATP
jgi:hypothetical protein